MWQRQPLLPRSIEYLRGIETLTNLLLLVQNIMENEYLDITPSATQVISHGALRCTTEYSHVVVGCNSLKCFHADFLVCRWKNRKSCNILMAESFLFISVCWTMMEWIEILTRKDERNHFQFDLYYIELLVRWCGKLVVIKDTRLIYCDYIKDIN